MIVRAYPIVGRIEDVITFASGLRQHPADTTAFYERLGVRRESWYVQDSPTGRQLIVVTIVDDLDMTQRRYAAASDRFETWFKNQVLLLSGVDPAKEPLGPPSTEVFEWSPPTGVSTQAQRAV